MANLKGGNYEKQIKDASMRMNKIGEKKESSNNSHSIRTHENRKSMLNDFAKYATENNLDSKLNKAMTTENINSFLNERLDNLKASTQESYMRTFGAMIESLKDNNISVSSSSSDFNERVHEVKANDNSEIERNRAISNPYEVISNLNDKNFSHAVVAEVQLELGLRVSEAVEVVNNLDKYLNERNLSIDKVTGKGGREYIQKDVSLDLIAKIELADKVDKRVYQADLQELGIKSHDFRYTFVKAKDEEKVAHEEISLEMNHKRIDITNYYLSRA